MDRGKDCMTCLYCGRCDRVSVAWGSELGEQCPVCGRPSAFRLGATTPEALADALQGELVRRGATRSEASRFNTLFELGLQRARQRQLSVGAG